MQAIHASSHPLSKSRTTIATRLILTVHVHNFVHCVSEVLNSLIVEMLILSLGVYLLNVKSRVVLVSYERWIFVWMLLRLVFKLLFLLLTLRVNIINDSSSDDDGDWDDDDYDCHASEDGRDMGLEEDPYEPGGAFNDPLFDEYYSLHFQTAR
jgi:ABC-type protease/lipase transport system fused ATPase/permease subunit